MISDVTRAEASDRRGTGLSVGEVARLAGVSVRTLHHYDEVGLLQPGGRTLAGYRSYQQAEVERLHRILAYRELGFGLDQIAELLAGGADPISHLRRQHGLLTQRIDRMRRMVANIEKTMEAHTMGISLTPEEMLEVFGDADPAQHAEEVEERWGESEQYRQSQQRAASYTKADWIEMKAEGEQIVRAFATAMAAGLPADGAAAMDAAQAHRQHLERWFYDVPNELHKGLADMYLADARFTKTYDDVAPGLAQYVHDAIHANAGRV